MKFNTLPPLKVLVLCIVLIFQFSCSKDSDLLTDYVLADTTKDLVIAKFVVDDTFEMSLENTIVLDVLANDTFENDAEVIITETSTPTNGTVAINNDDTLTYTPSAEIIEQVSDTTNASTVEVIDTFTYTVDAGNGDGTATVLITTADNAARQDVVNISPFDYCQDGNPIGGGAGYDAILSSADADIHITSTMTASAFKTLVESAISGDVIFIDSGVTIDLTGLTPEGDPTIHVQGGVTIASDRGTNAGALIKTDDMAYLGSGTGRPVFNTMGTGVRFTGLRIQGPYGEKGTYSASDDSVRRAKWGISSHWDNTEVDNCELYNFPRAAITLSNMTSAANVGFYGPNQWSKGHLMHHNYIHNNRQASFGYGVDVHRTDVVIYGNIFEKNRHDIAGGGDPSPNYSAYEAYCNTIRTGGTHHNFDMHGEVNDANCTDCTGGKFVYIHHNDFEDDGVNHGATNKENIRIRGIPENSVTVEYNRFAHPDFATAFKQTNVTSPPQNVVESNNTYK